MKTKYLNLLTLLCLVVCLVLSVGVAYGRYQWEFPGQSYVFTPELPANLFLCGHISEGGLNGGTLPALEEKWLPDGEGVKLDFGVTNGNGQQVSQENQTYVVRLAAGLSIENPEKLIVTLYWWDSDGTSHWQNGVPTPIEKGSALHASYGDGWVYRFYGEQEELTFALTGGQLSYANYTIAVSGEVESTLLDLQILEQDI